MNLNREKYRGKDEPIDRDQHHKNWELNDIIENNELARGAPLSKPKPNSEEGQVTAFVNEVVKRLSEINCALYLYRKNDTPENKTTYKDKIKAYRRYIDDKETPSHGIDTSTLTIETVVHGGYVSDVRIIADVKRVRKADAPGTVTRHSSSFNSVYPYAPPPS